ncbi:MAG: radical SAM family heme chaperone HemW [Clostridium sp.]|nr:radical SAM family heme chaperone HemW [Acetatifactor muris]MCM1526054.1 radical SAM family heme chaperone HemW [Bacteroides sp.]MCM1562186.1 radical SAM family heme chaperone HemW [Clostridium sp.]
MTKNRDERDLELYVHIPFCAQKCNYCDFLSAPATKQVQNAYMEAVCSEIRAVAGRLRNVVDSVFIGGGTPSAVEARWIMRLMKTIRAGFELSEDAEISMEMNPGTADEESLAIWREAGVNRLSIGCQSAVDEELRLLGRIHDYKQFADTYERAVRAGFDNINVDLMSGLPGQTMADWEYTLRSVLALKPAPRHISAYGLMVEEGTPFGEMARRGELDLPDEETEREMYWRAARILGDAGYEHYEISNYAREGYRCRHNCGYWLRRDYLGFGLGAASLFEDKRFRNTDSLKRYLAAPADCREDLQELGARERMEETLFLGLRMADGVDTRKFRAQFGAEIEEIYGEAIRRNERDGLLERRGDCLVLTKRGVDVSNYVMAQFLI